jgi:hypothetical protein
MPGPPSASGLLGGLTPAGLPPVGNYVAQAQRGTELIQQITGGDEGPLLQAGVSLVNAFSGKLGGGGAVIVDALSGALSGAAVAGPCGAVVGGVVAAVGAAASMFSPADSVLELIGVSQATQTITANVAALVGAHPNPWTGKPQGWALSDYLYATAYAQTSRSPRWAAVYNSALLQLDTWGRSSPASGGAIWGSGPWTAPSARIQDQVTVCTPFLFEWYESADITDCLYDLLFGPGQVGSNTQASANAVAALRQDFHQSVYALPHLRQDQIVSRAIARAPDPMWRAAGLFGATYGSGIFNSGWATVYVNLDLANAVATSLAMLSIGASSMAITSELLMQSAILRKSGNLDPAGQPIPNATTLAPKQVQFGFHQFVDAWIEQCRRENAAAKRAA